jgi:tetratricopeptide (TPR) repeat protein
MLVRESRFDEAMHLLAKARKSRRNPAIVQRNIAALYRQIDLPSRAIPRYRKALELEPDFASAHSGLLLAMHYLEPFDAKGVFDEHVRFNTQHAAKLAPAEPIQIADRDPNRRLRIGYVSPDFPHALRLVLHDADY